MLILHATFCRDGPHLWGESTPPESRSAKPDPAVAGAYPYRGGGEASRECLARIGLSLTQEATAGAQTV